MFAFEKNIVHFFHKNQIASEFEEELHLLSSEKINIQFHPNLSDANERIESAVANPLIHLWEDIYNARKPQVESRIKSLLGLNKRLHGRETTIAMLQQQDYIDFLNDHHLMGATKAKYRIGLFYQQELVALAGFGRECPIDHEGRTYRSSELIRFCNKSGITVVGGLTKLLDFFINKNRVEHLMTPVDREWSSGDLFSRLGFELVAITPPQQFLVSPDDGKRYRSSELARLEVNYDGWPEVSNLGNYKFIKILA